MRRKEYKPLLFTTTLRNPERMKVFLKVLAKYDGQILTNALIDKVVIDLVSQKLYVPNYVGTKKHLKAQMALEDEPFNLKDTLDIIKNSKQEHKEAGFDKGWPSRFDTWYKFLKELGFVYYAMNEQIHISELGNKLVLSNDEGYEHLENQAFLNAFVKYQRNNPYRRILNDNKPLILLLQVIMELRKRLGDNSKGICINEVPLLICWKDDNYLALVDEIINIRKLYGYTASRECIYDICKRVLEISEGDEKRFKISNITEELPDEFIRKMRLTGVISVRGMGRFIDINSLEKEKVEYILENYVGQKVFANVGEYFNYMKTIDSELLNPARVVTPSKAEEHRLFMNWVNAFELTDICSELMILTQSKAKSTHNVLKYINEPLRLEFLTALALQKKYTSIVVNPNYSIDDEGVPTSYASGGTPDIVCKDDKGNVLFEVTMIVGAQQCVREMNAITRHLQDCIKIEKDSFSVILAPRIHEDTIRFAKFVKFDENIDIIPLDILNFVNSLNINISIRQYKGE